ncbi:ABC transporter substrate-binding protein [Herminiimonas sp.]|uniref:ABC transporter substrate-binding protein n=1 Tax=Herminiimonas sp. TaxID=1926289 RepID=UPI002723FC14|nr:ABC transporter substrate-binding protein [Herminiimonas sp.]MDO8304926.1 ABC transporter substrate-binding protein [Herminiimonas sp.]
MRFKKIPVLLCVLFASILCRAETGVTNTSIILGQSAALSGPAEELGKGMRDGAQAYFDSINAQGGVFGRKIVLKTLDDGYDAERAAENTKKLIGQEGAFALFGYVGTPTSVASMPAITKAQIPVFAPFTGAEILRDPPNRNVFHVRASYYQETEKIIEHITTLSFKKVAVFYQNDAYGKAGLEGVTRALKKRNIEVVALATVERNSTDVAEAVQKMKQSDPQAIVMVSAYNSCAAFIRAMIAAGKRPLFWNISFVGSRALAEELGTDAGGVNISQVMPAPWDDITPISKEYRKLYLQNNKREWDYVSMEGFIAAKVFVEGLKRAGKDLTRDKLITAMESMTMYDTGGFVVRFSPSRHTGSEYVDLTMISKTGKFLH